MRTVLAAALLASALLTSGTGCVTAEGDPMAPSAAGTLTLATSADITQYHTLEIHFDRLDGTYGESSVAVREPPFSFPMAFDTELGFGASDAHTYRLNVWFSNSTYAAPSTTPPAGAPHGSTDIGIGDCTDGCATVRGVELALQ